jgi:chlorobactene glucosyltransferase
VTILACYGWLLIAWLLYCAVENTQLFAKPPVLDGDRQIWPKISILIPARNEEKRIERCLKHLLELDYPNYEILVLDDRSTDNTFNLVEAYSQRNPMPSSGLAVFKVIRGQELPPGWLGKPWACQQLAEAAEGEWFFFIDADTWHLQETLKRTVQMAEATDADVLSLLTRQVTQTPMEALVVPVMAFHLLAYFPARWALNAHSRWNRFAGVSGQFIFMKKNVYRNIGGHELVKNEIVEDLQFGKKLVRSGVRVVLGDGSDFAFCRMYTNAREVWEGFSKNFYPAMGFSTPAFIGCSCILILNGVLPFAALYFSYGTALFVPAFFLCLTLWNIRLLEAAQYGMSRWSVLFHPLGCLLFALIGLNSLWWFYSGKGHWKGRVLTAPQR